MLKYVKTYESSIFDYVESQKVFHIRQDALTKAYCTISQLFSSPPAHSGTIAIKSVDTGVIIVFDYTRASATAGAGYWCENLDHGLFVFVSSY